LPRPMQVISALDFHAVSANILALCTHTTMWI